MAYTLEISVLVKQCCYMIFVTARRMRIIVFYAHFFTLELSTPLESGEHVLFAYEIALIDMVSLQRKEQNYFVLCAFLPQ